MSNFIHKTTKEYRKSVNDPDYAGGDWLLVEGDNQLVIDSTPAKYIKITGGVLTAMTDEERLIVDAAEKQVSHDAIADQLLVEGNEMRALLLLVIDELNSRTAALNSILQSIAKSGDVAGIKTEMGKIAALPEITLEGIKETYKTKLGA